MKRRLLARQNAFKCCFCGCSVLVQAQLEMEFKLQGSSHFSRVITQQLSALTLNFSLQFVVAIFYIYIYIWFNYVIFEQLLVICLLCLLWRSERAASKEADDLFPSIFTRLIFSLLTHYLGLWFLAAHLVVYYVFIA